MMISKTMRCNETFFFLSIGGKVLYFFPTVLYLEGCKPEVLYSHPAITWNLRMKPQKEREARR